MKETTRKQISLLVRREVRRAQNDMRATAVQVQHLREKMAEEHPEENEKQIARRVEMTDMYRIHMVNVEKLEKAMIVEADWEKECRHV